MGKSIEFCFQTPCRGAGGRQGRTRRRRRGARSPHRPFRGVSPAFPVRRDVRADARSPVLYPFSPVPGMTFRTKAPVCGEGRSASADVVGVSVPGHARASEDRGRRLCGGVYVFPDLCGCTFPHMSMCSATVHVVVRPTFGILDKTQSPCETEADRGLTTKASYVPKQTTT